MRGKLLPIFITRPFELPGCDRQSHAFEKPAHRRRLEQTSALIPSLLKCAHDYVVVDAKKARFYSMVWMSNEQAGRLSPESRIHEITIKYSPKLF
jgi:hypothetical protein